MVFTEVRIRMRNDGQSRVKVMMIIAGTMPNIARNCIINIGETVVYDAVKDGLISSGLMKDGIWCHLAAAGTAGVTATVVASPVDVIKTRWGAEDRVWLTQCWQVHERREGQVHRGLELCYHHYQG